MIDPTDQSTPKPTMKIALAHDWLVARRGGELVLDAIAQTLREDEHAITQIYAMFDSGASITPAIDGLNKVVSPLNKLPQSLRRWQLFRYPGAVRDLSERLAEDHRAERLNMLISTHSAAIKALQPPEITGQTGSIPHLCYCHTPARYLWSQQGAYGTGGIKGRLRSLGLGVCTPRLRRWDRDTAKTVSQFIANSSHTAALIKEHYDRDSVVIHPPVRTDVFTLPENDDAPQRTDTLLLVSALEPYKRVDLAIDAAVLAGRELLIVGTGSHEAQLRKHAQRARKRAGSRTPIRFLGYQTDEQLVVLYQSAGAFLFPQIEDFGITAVEAQACGCPVVARDAGGALDTVIADEHYATGAFFSEPNAEAIRDAIGRVPSDPEIAQRCRDNVLRFSEKQFADKLREQINRWR